MRDANPLQPGFMIVHGNRLDDLRALAVNWMKGYPLAPLENEVVLVQSNGIAQWLKLALAEDQGCGIAAALDVQLPARFLWHTYRKVIGDAATPEQSPLDKDALTWRLMRLLPTLLGQPAFASLQRFLANDDDQRKLHQLAARLADLFDQYQVYRADWLEDWAADRDCLRTINAAPAPLEDANRWQAQLWRAVLADVGSDALQQSRSGVHRAFLERLQALTERPSGLARRVVVFGISSLPAQTLEALAALAKFSQVLLCVHNPCRHHWIDIVADKDLLRHAYRRQTHRQPPALSAAAELGQPLLAAWGKQGRDYINLLDSYDDPASYQGLFSGVNGGRIDLFSDEPAASLLTQLQNDILELRPLGESRAFWPAVDPASDHSVRFHIAHSPQREVEILHDQLLARFSADATLTPREVIVMVPDINAYAPHIQAVFGQLDRQDPRFIPFTLADQGRRAREPLLIALEHLLRLPHSRFAVSDILDLLDVPALRARFGIGETDLPTLQRWIEGAGIRWGLDGAQRQSLDLPADLEQNTWRFGLRRMLLGYAAGKALALHGIEPYDEVAGLEAALAGPLLNLLEYLEVARLDLLQAASPGVWVERLRALLNVFFKAQNDADELLLNQLLLGLEDWLETCNQAGFSEPLALNVVHEVWLAGMEQGGLSQRFLAGAVNFCTLMPMRAIPFRLVCLLGMNDGDYPRQQSHVDFDLMRHDYRPGDRSRREDDRYLLLEALLSAREQLYVSWVGRNIRDNSERVPSVLIAQLRDHLDAGWQPAAGQGLLAALTREHPLQPFSRAYFAGEAGLDGLFTYSHEWRAVHLPGAIAPTTAKLPALSQEVPLNLAQLTHFLRQPVEAFFEQRLKVHFDHQALTSLDEEPFALDGLENWQYQDELSQILKRWVEDQYDPNHLTAALDSQVQRLQREGKLPLAGFAGLSAATLTGAMPDLLERYHRLLQAWPQQVPGQIEVKLPAAGAAPGFTDWLGGLRRNATGELAYLQLDSKKLDSDQGLRWHNLIRPWLRHLALQLGQEPCTTILVSLSGDLHFPPIAKPRATELLQNLLICWAEGMCEPLPIACKSAFAWLDKGTDDAEKALEAAQKEYEGGFEHTGEVQGSTALRRAYADFEALTADDRFTALAGQLYGALHQQLSAGNSGSEA